MKVVVFDLDGTLIDGNNEVIGGEKTIHLLHKLQSLGYKLAICTGRLDHDIVAIDEKFQLGIDERISQNGAVFYQGNHMEATLLKKDTALKVYNELRNFPVRVEMNTISNRYWTSPRDPGFPKEFYDSSIIKEDLSCVIPYQPVVLFLVVGDYESLKEIQKYIKQHFQDVEAIFTSQTSLEIVSSHISKGEAVHVMYPHAKIYAIGDSESDLSMKKYADRFFYIGHNEPMTESVDDIYQALKMIIED